MNTLPELHVLGLMSGTSCDGLDLALCSFSGNAGKPDFKLISAKTIVYNARWEKRLQSALHVSALELAKLENEWTRFVAEQVSTFVKEQAVRVDLIGFHGHTVFHQPEHGLTFQMGSGATLSVLTNISVVCDFRRPDVAAGGQGAPLVPMGELHLFPSFDAFLNIGGFANMSIRKGTTMKAFDICPANIVLNRYARMLNRHYDYGGQLAKSGSLILELLRELNKTEYYHNSNKGSLGLEWVEKEIIPVIENWLNSNTRKDLSIEEKACQILNTVTEHIAEQIGSLLQSGQTMVTGGGALNTYLMERVQFYSKSKLVLPDKQLIDFKEAIIFAYLAYLRFYQLPNTLTEVTRANRELSAGALYSTL